MVETQTGNKGAGFMKRITSIAIVAALLAIPANPASSTQVVSENNRTQVAPVIVKSLTDYPGRIRTVTETQKAEIRAVSERLYGNTKFICTGARVAYNPYGINISV